MNGKEQKDRHTAVTKLRADLGKLESGLMYAIIQTELRLKEEMSQNHSHVTGKSIPEQRHFAEHIQQTCDDRWADNGDAHRRMIADLIDFKQRTFLGRLRWLFRGL